MGSTTEPQFFNIINDELRGSSESHHVTDPRTEEPLWSCPIATTEELEEAVTAARNALPAWSRSTVAERQAVLVKLADNLKEHSQELMEIVMKETGKSSLLAQIEIQNTLTQCLYYTKVALEDEVQFEDATSKIVATHVPLGVVAAICPWNFPLILSSIKVFSALATGNCVIVKPSPFTPYSVLKWVELARGIVPAGVFQALNGGADLGGLMTSHPGIDMITFTGTIGTGKKVMAACAKTLKRVTLELAGNDAAVVCADVDIATTAVKVAAGGFFNAGQMCVATKRVYVHESIYDQFLDALVAEVEKGYTIQDDANTPCVFGPLDNKMQYDVVKGMLEDCRKNGYRIATGGKVRDRGFWLEPTVVVKPDEGSLLVREEQFGPILPIMSWSDEDDVIKRANLANAGLGASVYSKDLARAEKIARRLEAGSVYINMSEKPNPGGYFSGFKDSGFGGEMGKQGLFSYCNTQSLHFAKV